MIDLKAILLLCIIKAATTTPSSAPNHKTYADNGKTIVYIGGYTEKPPFSESWLLGPATSQAIRAYQFNQNDGSLTLLREYGPDFIGKNPIYMVTTKNEGFLYALNSLVGNNEESNIASFKIDKNNNGELIKINTAIGTGGSDAVHISLDDNEEFLFVAHYGGSAFSVFRRNPDGSVGDRVFAERYPTINNVQPHPHSAYSRKNKYVYVPDLGRNLVINYEIDSLTGTCFPNRSQRQGLQISGGPRHMAFNSNGLYVYVISELTSQVSVLYIDPQNGKLSIVSQISTLPSGVGFGSSAAIRISTDQKFLFVSNRANVNSITAFRIEFSGSKLALIGSYSIDGNGPRDFIVVNDYLVVLGQNSASVATFRIHGDGSLSKTFGPIGVALPLAAVAIHI
jgi:6-phosphogluconolactonase